MLRPGTTVTLEAIKHVQRQYNLVRDFRTDESVPATGGGMLLQDLESAHYRYGSEHFISLYLTRFDEDWEDVLIECGVTVSSSAQGEANKVRKLQQDQITSWTPFHKLAAGHSSATIKLVDNFNADGLKLAHCAAICGRVDVLELIAKKIPGQIDELDRAGRTVEQLAELNASPDLLAWIERRGSAALISTFCSSVYRRDKATKERKTMIKQITRIEAVYRGHAMRKLYRPAIELRIEQRKRYEFLWLSIPSELRFVRDRLDLWEAIKQDRFNVARNLETLQEYGETFKLLDEAGDEAFYDSEDEKDETDHCGAATGGRSNANGSSDVIDSAQEEPASAIDSTASSSSKPTALSPMAREWVPEAQWSISEEKKDDDTDSIEYEKKQAWAGLTVEKVEKVSASSQPVKENLETPADAESKALELKELRDFDCPPFPMDNIKITKAVLSWIRKTESKYVEFFLRRIEQLASGQRSRILQKNLVGSKTTIYETYLEQRCAQRILWTPCLDVSKEEKHSILIWYVAQHHEVSRLMELIDDAQKREARTFVPASSLYTGDTMPIGPEEILLDPIRDIPLKLHQIAVGDIRKLESASWVPPLRLTPEERECVEKDGTVLLLGRSGTGEFHVL